MENYWQFFAEEARLIGSALYQSLALAIDKDEDLKALAALARPGQPHANMLFGAVHFILLRGGHHPLRNFYPTLGGGWSSDDKTLFPAFRDFVTRHRDEIAALVSTRVTNTNEVGRSAVLHAGFRALAEQTREPLHLVEIGPSAGLNLIWDRYGVRYHQDGKTRADIAPVAPLVIDCELRGAGIPPTGPAPRIASRVGLELNPVDLTNVDDRDWLRALMWPDQVSRLARLDRAVSLFVAEKPSIRAGDALALLPQVLAELPDGAVCISHTIVTYQFSPEMKEDLDAFLRNATRPLYRLGLEYDGKNYALTLSRYGHGACEETVLAHAHPHGTWMDWLV